MKAAHTNVIHVSSKKPIESHVLLFCCFVLFCLWFLVLLLLFLVCSIKYNNLTFTCWGDISTCSIPLNPQKLHWDSIGIAFLSSHSHMWYFLFIRGSQLVINVVHQLQDSHIIWDCIMAESERTDSALRQDCEVYCWPFQVKANCCG